MTRLKKNTKKWKVKLLLLFNFEFLFKLLIFFLFFYLDKLENHRLNWTPQTNCHQCEAFELERQQEKEANTKSQRSAQTKKNHLAQRYASINKRKKQHNDCFHADLDTLEREVSQYKQRYNHIIPTG